MQKLIIEDDEGRTTVVPLVRDELTIGRKEGNTIRLTERNVSRRHARLFKKNGDVCVEDFGSFTGVKVNGVRISAATVLHDSDQVLIGGYKMAVRSETTAIETEQMPATVPGLPAAMLGSSGSSAAAPGDLAGAVAQARADIPARLDAAPTIPLRTLEEQGRAPQLPNAHPARLVVVTTELAGMEFRMDRPSLVIGRTEENDIIINHASISRHHAKVVRDGDRTTIVDLQSANGVRVAGESYERVDVQPGDVIELGHVKLRYVGPLEAWTYNPREFKPRSGRKVKIVAAGAGIALAVVLVVMLQGKTERNEEPPAPVVAVAVPHPPDAPTPAALFAEATSAAGSENWDKAVSALDLLLSRPTTEPEVAAVAPEAVELKRKVDFERRSAEVFASFQKAVEDKEPDVALSRFEDLPADSVYKSRAEPA
ncbi:MAG: FHA domain-containing protein, partial [Myxococcales bacterium]